METANHFGKNRQPHRPTPLHFICAQFSGSDPPSALAGMSSTTSVGGGPFSQYADGAEIVASLFDCPDMIWAYVAEIHVWTKLINKQLQVTRQLIPCAYRTNRHLEHDIVFANRAEYFR